MFYFFPSLLRCRFLHGCYKKKIDASWQTQKATSDYTLAFWTIQLKEKATAVALARGGVKQICEVREQKTALAYPYLGSFHLQPPVQAAVHMDYSAGLPVGRRPVVRGFLVMITWVCDPWRGRRHFPEAECLPLLRNWLKLVVCLSVWPNLKLSLRE